jgi:hypothetical protein
MEGLLSPITRRGLPSYPLLTGRPQPDGDHLGHGHPQYDQRMSLSGMTDYSGFPHPKPSPWMKNLCYKPHEDMETCCIGSWIPCALYGKTQYRLKQMAEGKDPLDESRHDACNGACVSFQMLTCFRLDCEFYFQEPDVYFPMLMAAIFCRVYSNATALSCPRYLQY